MAEHTVKAFSEELDAITQEVARMGGLAETAVNDALSAVARRDTELKSLSSAIRRSTPRSAKSKSARSSCLLSASRWRAICASCSPPGASPASWSA
jgi:hypothetical protein